MSDTDAAVHAHSPADAKIALFRSLFRGREDIYARRFENKKTGRSGYAPACANEWVRDIGKELDSVLDTILRVLASRERREAGKS